jgi:hypothetical protein
MQAVLAQSQLHGQVSLLLPVCCQSPPRGAIALGRA